MKKYNKSLLALLLGAMTVVGGAGVASARMGMHGGPHHGAYAASQVTPEMRQMMEKAYDAIAPLQLELRAKQQELTAKIYGGADDKTIQELSGQVTSLQTRLTESRIRMQRDFAKAGVPMFMGGCPMGGPGMHGGPGMTGMHGGMMHGGMGALGPCPGYLDRGADVPADGPANQ